MKKTILLCSFFLVLILPVVTNAGVISRSGDTISVDDEQSLNGDFYGAAQRITISGRAENDVYLAGVDVKINAPVAEDLVVFGGSIQIDNEIGDDVRVFGGTVTIGEHVGGDVIVAGGTLHVLSTAVIDGDLIFYGNSIHVEGEVAGTLRGDAERARVDAKVGGDVVLTVYETLSLGENAEILGTVTYESREALARSQDAIVLGDIHRKDIIDDTHGFIVDYFYGFAILLFALLTLYFFGKKYLGRITTDFTKSVGIDGLVGLGFFLLTPVVVLVLMVSVIGVLVGTILLLLYIIAIIVSILIAAIIMGQHFLKLTAKNTGITIGTLAAGSAIFALLTFVPVVGPILLFVSVMIVLGYIARVSFNKIRS